MPGFEDTRVTGSGSPAVVHPKDRTLFARIDAALEDYERERDASLEEHMERSAAEIDAIQETVAAVRSRRH